MNFTGMVKDDCTKGKVLGQIFFLTCKCYEIVSSTTPSSTQNTESSAYVQIILKICELHI